MKIVKLRFKNLNSLVGEWEIDFSTPDYLTDGIFAISGPTGSGKSTILDAICLALYGETPRLKTISQSTNEIMSRQTGECFSEVLFETNGKRYYSHWSQHKARKKVDGKLANPKHEISSADDGGIIASKISDSKSQIIKLSGMDFSRFTQSMMLAQGNFAAFLKASENERAPILEQITGTEIYSDISKRVFEQQREESGRLKELKAASEGILTISVDEEKKILQDVTDKKGKDKSLKKLKDEITEAINWLNKIDLLNKEMIQINHNKTVLGTELKAFEPQRVILKNALRAAEFESDYATIQALVVQQKSETEKLEELNIQVPILISELEDIAKKAETSKKNYDVLKKQEEDLRKLLKEVRTIDQKIVSKKEDIKKLELAFKSIESKLLFDSKTKGAQEKVLNKLTTELQDALQFLDKNKTDENLLTEFAGINVEASNLNDYRRNLLSVQSKLKANISEQKETKAVFEQTGKSLEDATSLLGNKKKEINQHKEEIEKLLNGFSLNDYRDKKDAALRDMARIQKVVNFEEERKLLKDEEACPVCGSTHHPYAEGNIPKPSEKEKELQHLNDFILNIEKLEAIQQQLLQDEIKLVQNCNKAEHNLKMIGQKNDDIENNLTELRKEEVTALTNVQNKTEQLLKQLAKYGVAEIPNNPEALKILLAQLKQRKTNWEENKKIRLNQEAKINECEKEISNITTRLKQNEEISKENRNDFAKDTDLAKELESERKKLFENKDCDKEEQLMLRKVELANNQFQEMIKLNHEAKSNLDTAQKKVEELKLSTTNRQTQLKDKKENFNKALLKVGFENEAAFLKARLSKNERDLLSETAQELDTKKIQLETLQKDNEEQLKIEQAKKVTEKPTELLQTELGETDELIESLGKEIGALEQRLKDNEAAKVRGQELLQKIAVQQKVFERWDKLNVLIGSADGKKYRNFAQGLTFELVVAYANRQLSKLSDRYILIRDNAKPLDLNVIDNYQAGEVRSTKNLSGGESFIVSLALALGLSQMSSKNVRVDSLFLDEGFGTLDEDTLETALGTLASLRQDGKMIGLISHVGALKDRISTQILVQPIREGRSILGGPGCRKI